MSRYMTDVLKDEHILSQYACSDPINLISGNTFVNIRLRYFASLKEITGRGEEVLAVPELATVADVRTQLQTRYPALQAILERCIYAVDKQYVPVETQLHENSEVVFIPPMGGGNLDCSGRQSR